MKNKKISFVVSPGLAKTHSSSLKKRKCILMITGQQIDNYTPG